MVQIGRQQEIQKPYLYLSTGYTFGLAQLLSWTGTLALSNGGTVEAPTVTVHCSGSSFTSDATINVCNAEVDTSNAKRMQLYEYMFLPWTLEQEE